MSAKQSLWIVLAGALFAVMGCNVKYAAAHMTTLEMVFYRSLIGCVMVAAFARFRLKTLRTSNFAVHVSRSVFGFLSLLLFFYAIPRVNLSTAMALLQTSPLFLALLSFILLRERPEKALVAALLTSFCGMLFVLRPQSDLQELSGGVAAAVSGFTAGCAYYNIRRLGFLQEGGIRTVFYFTLLCTVFAGAGLLILNNSTPFSLEKAGWAIAIAITATFGQLALTRGLHYGKTVISSALMYVSILFSGILDYALWRALPDGWGWLGIALIIGGSVAVLRRTAASGGVAQQLTVNS